MHSEHAQVLAIESMTDLSVEGVQDGGSSVD